MKLLILTKYFPPEIGAASHLFFELAESLTNRGHDVTVVTGFPTYNVDRDDLECRHRGGILKTEDMNGIRVRRVRTLPTPSWPPMLEKLDHATDPAAFFLPGLVEEGDVVFIYSPPLPLGITAALISALNDIPFVVNIQDLFPKEAVDLGMLEEGWLLRFFEIMEAVIYREADHLTVHSEGNGRHLLANGADEERVSVIHNWVDTESISPGPRMNEFREEHDLGDDFLVSYAGTMGHAQDMDVILGAAERLRGYDDITFLLVGDGAKKKRARKFVREEQLDNIRLLPMQPKETYPAILQASDVGLVTLEGSLETPVVPSKLFSIMASGRPVAATMQLEGDAPKIIREAECGYVSPAGDAETLAQNLLELYEAPELKEQFGENGRQYAVDNLSREAQVDEYETLFRNVAARA